MLQAAVEMPLSAVPQPPNFPGPHDFLVLSVITTIICGILNLVSIAIGITAIIFAVLVSSNACQMSCFGCNGVLLY